MSVPDNTLLTGADLLQSLIHILIRFRQNPHAVSGDIVRMFLQVGVIPEDRPSLRFLCREEMAGFDMSYDEFKSLC